MLSGYVKWFDDKKGFGFIVCDNKDYFVHYKDIEGVGHKTLADGDKVNFEPAMREKGWVAQSVTKQSD